MNFFKGKHHDHSLALETRCSPGRHLLHRGFRLSRDGFTRLLWPAVRPQVFVDHQAGPTLLPDTCVVTPDAGLYAIVWRCIVPAAGSLTLRVANA